MRLIRSPFRLATAVVVLLLPAACSDSPQSPPQTGLTSGSGGAPPAGGGTQAGSLSTMPGAGVSGSGQLMGGSGGSPANAGAATTAGATTIAGAVGVNAGANSGGMPQAGAPTAGGMPVTAGAPPAMGGTEGTMAGAAPVTAGAAGLPETPVGTISVSGDRAELELGDLAMTIDGGEGARITSFSLNGTNVLVTAGPITGSTFWPAPQDTWGWPPPETIDSDAYEVEEGDGFVLFTSDDDADIGIRVTKRFSFAPEGDGIVVEYGMIATSESVDWAPWEITRVDGGISFFEGQGNPSTDDLPGVVEQAGHVWYEYDEPNVPTWTENGETDAKIEQDGTGWLANANADTGLLLVKSFPDIPASSAAAGEEEIEVYANAITEDTPAPYVEVEATGPYGSVGTTPVTWAVTWKLVELPSGSDVSVGSQELLDLVSATLGK